MMTIAEIATRTIAGAETAKNEHQEGLLMWKRGQKLAPFFVSTAAILHYNPMLTRGERQNETHNANTGSNCTDGDFSADSGARSDGLQLVGFEL